MDHAKTAAVSACDGRWESGKVENGGDFFDCLSHELKTPITAIKGFAELMLEVELTEDERRQYLQVIIDEAARLASLVNSANLLAQLSGQSIAVKRSAYALDEQLGRCLTLLSPSREKKGILLTTRLEPVSCWADEELMRHVWLNLLDNAIKYTPEGGTVHISSAQEGDMAVVQISDTGVGIPEEEQGRIFEKYYQRKTDRSGSGLGLGLFIVQRVLELCGGGVTGQGSTFTVCLPAKAGALRLEP